MSETAPGEAPGEDAGEGAKDTLGQYEGGRNSDNQRHGLGFAILPNGDMYDGMYRNGKRHGVGLYVFRNGARYKGDYRLGFKHGTGLFIYPDGSRYNGEWKKDKKNGYGIYEYPNGDVYKGSWYKGLRDGLGVYYFKSTATEYSGTWVKGKMHGPAEVIYPTFRYHGNWKNGLPLGKGTHTFGTITMQLGTYINIKDPLLQEEEKKEVTAPESEQPTEGQPDAEEKEKTEPLPKGIIPIWKPKEYIAYSTHRLPREPVPPERLPSPLSIEDKQLLSEDDEESLSMVILEGDEDFYKDEDITEILYYFLDMETRRELEYIFEAVSCDYDPFLGTDILGSDTALKKSPSQKLREIICGPGTDATFTDEEEEEEEEGEGEFAEMMNVSPEDFPG
ncbi:radial spoke head 1 homolog [Lycorma delicatula]|uniref:radial spoke head 1 homolog n=1 Tax=Lycorma delicatula TaxID=130591 RepID=UPI003F5102CA